MTQGLHLGTGSALRRAAAAAVIAMLCSGALAGCAAFNPQGTAQQYAPSYYNQDYASLTPDEKMKLEDHLSNQSNQAWRTTADVTSAVGHLAGGTGILLFAARNGRFW
jgi:curli biogenesis system outer membrane secretion channel CsgG